MKRVAISIGDLNGIGIEIALLAHKDISKIVNPVYCIDPKMLKQASRKLNLKIPSDFDISIPPNIEYFEITPGKTDAKSGAYSFYSFLHAISLVSDKKADAVTTLPIHKKAWEIAGVDYKGHTDALRDIFKSDAIMMLGSPKMFVALYTEHIPLKDVARSLSFDKFYNFLITLYGELNVSNIAVLGLNPHAGDGGVLGSEESIIKEAIKRANTELSKEIFTGPLVPDTAFTPIMRDKYNYYVAIYHDQGLIPLKTLYFDESINVSLNLPILRTSVDHGTAFDIAYKNQSPSTKSYINAIEYATKRNI